MLFTVFTYQNMVIKLTKSFLVPVSHKKNIYIQYVANRLVKIL